MYTRLDPTHWSLNGGVLFTSTTRVALQLAIYISALPSLVPTYAHQHFLVHHTSTETGTRHNCRTGFLSNHEVEGGGASRVWIVNTFLILHLSDNSLTTWGRVGPLISFHLLNQKKCIKLWVWSMFSYAMPTRAMCRAAKCLVTVLYIRVASYPLWGWHFHLFPFDFILSLCSIVTSTTRLVVLMLLVVAIIIAVNTLETIIFFVAEISSSSLSSPEP